MKVGIIMGSKSDWPTMKLAADMLDQFGVSYETKVVSAHRTPQLLADYASSAKERGIKVIIAGAGGAAHLPGMAAAFTSLPVLGVPGSISRSKRHGLFAIYCTNAKRHCCRHVSDWRSGRCKRGHLSGTDPRYS